MLGARDRQLDGLRAVAVTFVLYAHFFADQSTYWGHVGVRLFFVLSGFLITRILLQARSAAGLSRPRDSGPSTSVGRCESFRPISPRWASSGCLTLTRAGRAGPGMPSTFPTSGMRFATSGRPGCWPHMEPQHRGTVLPGVAARHSVGAAPSHRENLRGRDRLFDSLSLLLARRRIGFACARPAATGIHGCACVRRAAGRAQVDQYMGGRIGCGLSWLPLASRLSDAGVVWPGPGRTQFQDWLRWVAAARYCFSCLWS